MNERDVVVVAEQPHDLSAFVLAHQAMIDEDAGELIADRLMNEHGGDRRIAAAATCPRLPLLR